MRVIFLDIDGVLNSNDWNDMHQQQISAGKYIDESKVRMLSRIINSTDARVVLHSGWRFWFDDELKPIRFESEHLSQLLHKYGVCLYDKTPDLATDEIRKDQKFSQVKAKEILLWIDQHKGIEAYIVLEDIVLKNDEIRKHLIHVNAQIGLTETDIVKSIQRLTLEEGKI